MPSEAHLKANRKWREKNLQQITDKARQKYQSNEAYRKHIKAYNLARYHTQKELLLLCNISPDIFQ